MQVVEETRLGLALVVHRLVDDNMAGSRSRGGRTDVFAFPLPLETTGFTSSTSGSDFTAFVVAVLEFLAATLPRMGFVLRVAVSRLAVSLGITSKVEGFLLG